MKRSTIQVSIIILLLLISVPASSGIISPGDIFPPFNFGEGISSADAAYLGVDEAVKKGGQFQAEDIWGDVLVMELVNGFCFGSQQAASAFNSAYESVVSDPSLSTKVRFLGIGVGNDIKTVNDFRKEFGVQFPLVPDPGFTIFDTMGNPGGTPYTMILKKTSMGLIVVTSHFGAFDSAGELISLVREISEGDVKNLIGDAPKVRLPPWIEKRSAPPVTDAELEAKVLESMNRAGYGSVGLYTMNLAKGGKVYIGESNRGKVFSRVITRLPVCDVSSPIHFILTFNSRGQVVDFDAIYVTKYWNRKWSKEDVDQMRRKLLGISVLEERPFDPEVDAVTTATVSSSLIFDSLVRTEPVFKILKEEGRI